MYRGKYRGARRRLTEHWVVRPERAATLTNHVGNEIGKVSSETTKKNDIA